MSATTADAPEEKTKGKGGKRKPVLLIGVAGLVAVVGAGGWFSGIIPKLIGGHSYGAEASASASQPVFVDLPEIVANLNAGGRRASFIKLQAKLEVARKEDAATVQNAMPRVLDLFQGYLREMRPDELRGTAGTYRLREELVARTNIAAAPARVTDVLFVELLVQ